MDEDRLNQLDYYTLLGLEPTASQDEVKKAFRAFALKYHPDRFAGAPAEKVERATAIYRRGSEAVEALSDPRSRAAYDAVLAKGELRLTTDGRAAPRARTSVRPGASTTRRSQSGGTARRSRSGAKSERPPSQEIRSPSARAYYARALELAKAKDFATALRAVNAAIEQEPGNPLLEEAKKRLEAAVRR